MDDKPPLSFLQRPGSERARGWLVTAAFVLVALSLLAARPANIVLAPFFPAGLLAWLPNGEEKAIIARIMGIPVLLAWGIYFLIFRAIGRARTNGGFIVFYIILCLLLMLNVIGCHRVLRAAEGIE